MYLRSPYPPVPSVPVTNFHNILFREQNVPDHVMYIDAITGQERTRLEFLERLYDGATALAAGKNAGGVALTSADVVGILSDNCLDYIVLVHSLLAITTPFALFSTYATPREMAHTLRRSKATHIFVDASILPRFLPVARELRFPEHHIYILQGESPSGLSLPSFAQLIQNVRYNKIPREPVREAGKDTLAYLVFSSGTSGLPKAVMVSHGNLAFSLVQGSMIAQEYAKVTNPPNVPQVTLGFLPLFHSFGLHQIGLRDPSRKGTIVILPRWNMKVALRAIPRYRITTIPAIPSVIHQLVNAPEFHKTDLSSIVSFGSGAAHLPATLVERLKSILPGKVVMAEGYGMSEATIGIIAQPQPGLLDGRVEYIPDAAGILIPGMEGLILRPDGTQCLPMEAGELYIQGDNVTPGYWNDPDATKEAFIAGGWLRTGDRFKANTKGTFWFEDRVKDTLKVSGLQVSPAEIEEVLHAEPSGVVSDVAVAGVQTPGARTSDDQSPRAWVVLTAEGRQLGEQAVRDRLERWAKTNLSKYKWLRGGIQFVPEIPKTPTGKILRRVLQEQYASESTRAKL